ncbi:DUF5602 domain-containing protein [Pontibacter ruber]|uniref:DUF5602 domain-containing protein n=1 Tax=Pontibacter ruber TaxID=1343895 RepID=A0ABW5D4J5_9BACT|nr:DUF5602 domain-containing protein [Pontibacter ruber]
MKNHNHSARRLRGVYSLLLLVFALAACDKQEEALPDQLNAQATVDAKEGKTTIHYGPATPLGQGVARAWVEVTRDGTPVAIGVNMSAKAAASLPEKPMMYEVQLPKQGDLTQYTTIGLDWNPGGHPPMPYLKPHFDVHFYMISDEERMMIPHEPLHEFSAEFAANYMPPLYISTREAIPAMGVHWADVLSPELAPNGPSFTKTLILGGYNNKFLFIEPMITLDYLQHLEGNVPVVSPIRQAPKVQQSGYYPLTYTILYDPTPGEYEISLTDLQYRAAE